MKSVWFKYSTICNRPKSHTHTFHSMNDCEWLWKQFLFFLCLIFRELFMKFKTYTCGSGVLYAYWIWPMFDIRSLCVHLLSHSYHWRMVASNQTYFNFIAKSWTSAMVFFSVISRNWFAYVSRTFNRKKIRFVNDVLIFTDVTSAKKTSAWWRSCIPLTTPLMVFWLFDFH